MDKLTRNLKEIIKRVDKGGLSDAQALADFLKKNGFVSGQHVGKDPKEFTPRMTMEWYCGQGIAIVESQAWFAMNSWLNCSDKFIMDDYEVEYLPENLFRIE